MPQQVPPKLKPDQWAPVPGKPHLEQNGLGQWRTVGHSSDTFLQRYGIKEPVQRLYKQFDIIFP